MTAIKEIVDLQNIDLKLQEIASLLGDLPLKVDALKDEEKSLTESLENGKNRLKELDLELNKCDSSIEEINKSAVKKILATKKIPDFFAGDTIKVGVRIVEGKRERIQYFEGVCIAKKNRDINSSFTVRKISFGEGVERTFALYSPIISSIKINSTSPNIPRSIFKSICQCYTTSSSSLVSTVNIIIRC